MKIVVNKEKAKQRKEEVIQEILAMAQKTANEGKKSFIYYFKEGERNSFPPPLINISVKLASEGTVECGYRSDYGTHVKYYICE